MTRTGPRVVPGRLAALSVALVLALGALVSPVLRAPAPAEVGRVVSAVHVHGAGAAAHHNDRTRATISGAHLDGAAPGAGGGTGGPFGPDVAGVAAQVAGFAIVLAALGVAVALALRRRGRSVPAVRGRGPPVGPADRRPDHRTGARPCPDPAPWYFVLHSS